MNTDLLLQLLLIGGPASLAGFTFGVLYGRGTASKAVRYEEPMEWQEPQRITRLTSRNGRIEL